MDQHFENETRECKTCGDAYVFTASEQRFYSEKGFYKPQHCGPCRARNKARREAHQRRIDDSSQTRESAMRFDR